MTWLVPPALAAAVAPADVDAAGSGCVPLGVCVFTDCGVAWQASAGDGAGVDTEEMGWSRHGNASDVRVDAGALGCLVHADAGAGAGAATEEASTTGTRGEVVGDVDDVGCLSATCGNQPVWQTHWPP